MSGDRAVREPALLDAIHLWASLATVGNMNLERLLALIRSTSPDRCCVERITSAGYLVQLQQKHLAAGGADVRKLTRRQLLKAGAPIRAAGRNARQKRAGRLGGCRRGFTAWCNSKQREDRVGAGQVQRRSREQYRNYLRELRAEWDLLPLPAQAAFRDAHEDEPDAGMTYEDRIGNRLMGCSVESSPVSHALLEKLLQGELGASEKRTQGLTDTLEPLRTAFLDSRLMCDTGRPYKM